MSKDATEVHVGPDILKERESVEKRQFVVIISDEESNNNEDLSEGPSDSEREGYDHEGQDSEQESESKSDEELGQDSGEETGGMNFAILFCSATAVVSGHLRNPEHSVHLQPGKVMVVIYKGRVAIYIGFKGENRPALAVPASGKLNEPFLEWEIHRKGCDLRMDMAATRRLVDTHIRLNFCDRIEFLSFKQSLSANADRIFSGNGSDPDWRWILHCFKVL
ncbi:hypothetical protein GYMLUDRAFT_59296 [Collybiopsis luxurians FD-317 M1]|uniref:Uncharacterized protein n=1 Tax=Collybiopsis luxurians FD-317 M1 TaxID=944289 RepID=A0A0D0CPU1_9AGAR|nr:hypothetical protein GYMLUDRAFT_59296 [Collybiopsis luxurians FD-317 M1]